MKKLIIISIAASLMLVSCNATNNVTDNKIKYAKAVLLQAQKDGYLDAAGQAMLAALDASKAPLKSYIALIEVCERGEGFYDVTASTDAWETYATQVLEK